MQERVARRAARLLLRPDENNPKLTCVKYSPDQPIATSHSGEQPFYIVARNITQAPAGSQALYDLLVRQVRTRCLYLTAVGGVKSGGIVPGREVARQLNKPFVQLYALNKGHGIAQDLNGIAPRGEILAVDDTVNSGRSLLDSLSCLGALKEKVKSAAALVDYDLPSMWQLFAEAKIDYQGLTNIQVILKEASKMRFYTDKEIADILTWYAKRYRLAL